MSTTEEIMEVGEDKRLFYQHATPDEIEQIQQAIHARSEELLAESQRLTNESLKIIGEHGFEISLSEWLTVARYAKKYAVSQQVVTNWISRGTVPADCILAIPELNDIRLIRDRLYM